MVRVKIVGAGSIGNHLAYASRTTKGWDVLMCDLDADALHRTRNEIYPQRYGAWDDQIQLSMVKDAPCGTFDVVMIGTPPHTHLSIAFDVLQHEQPKVLAIEKPICTPSLEHAQKLYDIARNSDTAVLVGHNHTLCKNTVTAEQILRQGGLGSIVTIHSGIHEHWGGIYQAHPWLQGPQDTYLGYTAKGGGAVGEHSHGINNWQHFAHLLDLGKIVEVTATMDMVQEGRADYDRIVNIAVRTDRGFYGTIVQDVVTSPVKKHVRIQGKDGYLEWFVRYDAAHDAVVYHQNGKDPQTVLIPQKRTDDFQCEIEHIDKILNREIKREDSPIAIERGLDTMLVIAAAYLSHQQKKAMRIDYTKGYSLEAITPA